MKNKAVDRKVGVSLRQWNRIQERNAKIYRNESDSLNHKVSKYLNALERLFLVPSDIYVDTNILNFRWRKGEDLFFKTYLSAHFHNCFPWQLGILNDAAKNFSDGLVNLLSRDNVYVTSGVFREFESIRNSISKRCIDRGILSSRYGEILSPLDNILNVSKAKNKAVLDEGLEENPVVGRICSLLDKKVSFGRSLPLSDTDKKLVAVPFATGFIDGRNKLVITNDGEVQSAIPYLVYLLHNDCSKLEMTDLMPAEDLKRFAIRAASIYSLKKGGFLTEHYAEFHSAPFIKAIS